MSRSYRKPYDYWVCMSPANVRGVKRMASRAYRNKMNRGDYDDFPSSRAVYKKVEDLKWYYDLQKRYVDTQGQPDWYIKKVTRK